MSITQVFVPNAVHMMTALTTWLDKGAAMAGERGNSPDDLLGLRLAPDMFSLASQVRFAAFQAQEPVYRLRGEGLPAILEEVRREAWNAGERPGTLAQARSRVEESLALLSEVAEAELDGAAERAIELVIPDGTTFDMTGSTYVRDWALPQLSFHAVVAYAILRAHGVSLGKADYVPHMFDYVRPGTLPQR